MINNLYKNLTDTDGATIILTATWKEKDYTGEPIILYLPLTMVLIQLQKLQLNLE